MKLFRATFALLPLAFSLTLAHAQNADFPGVEKAMSDKVFKAAGLDKLTPEERARLDEFSRSYTASANQEAAKVAVDEVVNGKKLHSLSQVIASRIVVAIR